MKEELIAFIKWAEENSSDAWDIYDNTEEMIDKYLKEKND